MTDRACRIHITVKPSEIIYLNGLIDSYENIGIMRTEDEIKGKATVYTTAGCENILAGLLESLQNEGLRLKIDCVDYNDELI